MNASERADAYLILCSDRAMNPAGLRWSANGDAVETAGGDTFAVAEEVAALLSGVCQTHATPPFAFVMALFSLMKRDGSPNTWSPLTRAYRKAYEEESATLTRNAGLLIAHLCRGYLNVVSHPGLDEIVRTLRRLRMKPDRPGVGPPQIVWSYAEEFIASRLRQHEDSVWLHWLKFGCAPPSGMPSADAVEPPPGRVLSLLDHARRRPRLVGAALLAPAVEAAVTLPARRRRADPLPQGGYADVTTRGDPGRLLPGQFALDPDEFVRRFAAGELLYFQREEPHAAPPPERVVVMDQGVRTWGGVRLALAAAAISLLGRDRRRFGVVRLFTSSAPYPLDPTGAGPEELAGRLEVSDLTSDPSRVLDRAVAEPGDQPRDLVLLTHPRNLQEGLVLSAALKLRPTDRLFAVTVDDRGRGGHGEWVGCGWRTIREFRVDLAGAEAARVSDDPTRHHRPGTWGPWTGDVEPVPFPFRPGLVGEPEVLGFDADGEWAVAVGRDGVPHGLTADGSPPEVLPRAYRGGVVLKFVDAVVGVNGGVVLCGRFAPPSRTPVVAVVPAGSPVTHSSASPPDDPVDADGWATDGATQFVAAHYDRATRRVRLYPLGPASGRAEWASYPDLDCVAVRTTNASPGFTGRALDLGTGGRWPSTGGTGLVSRAKAAWGRPFDPGSPPHPLAIETDGTARGGRRGGPALFMSGNAVRVTGTDRPWPPFEPTCEGRPLLAGHTVDHAVLAGDALAVTLARSGKRKLVLFRRPDGAVAGEFPYTPRGTPYALSPDGRRLARWFGRREVVISDVIGNGTSDVVGSPARLHTDIAIGLEAVPFWLGLRVGQFEHHFGLDDDRLRYARETTNARWGNLPACGLPLTGYDPGRFPMKETATAEPLRAALDRLGQVLLFTDAGTLVAAFVVRRDKAAAWLPEGTFWGDPALIGGPPTPGADRKFAEALTAAGG